MGNVSDRNGSLSFKLSNSHVKAIRTWQQTHTSNVLDFAVLMEFTKTHATIVLAIDLQLFSAYEFFYFQ